MEIDATRMCRLLVGLPDVNVLGVGHDRDGRLVIAIESRIERPACESCGRPVRIKDRPVVELADLPCSAVRRA